LAHIEGLYDILTDCLDDNELIIAKTLFGLNGFGIHSLNEVGRTLGCSAMTVRNNRTRILLKLLHPASPARPVIMESLGLSVEALDRAHASCLELGLHEVFRTPARQSIIDTFCGSCAMQEQCRFEGMALGMRVGTRNTHQYGIWGGQTPPQRVEDLRADPGLLQTARAQSPLVGTISLRS
jgi:hypothetical protein